MKIVSWTNNFYSKYTSALNGQSADYLPFHVNETPVGVIPKYAWDHFKNFKDTFKFDADRIVISLDPSLKTKEERTARVEQVLQSLRSKSSQTCLPAILGWRDEHYVVSKSFSSPVLMTIERAATSLFGTKSYGVHVNGIVRSSSTPPHSDESSPSEVYMWIGRRSKTKQTYPSKLDHIAAGGLTAGMPIHDVLVRECEEEASIPSELTLRSATSVGSISYCYEDELGIHPEREFCYDLILPPDFKPVNADGETEEFFLWPIEKVMQELVKGDFKPNVAIVILHFLIRSGIVHPDLDPRYTDFMDGIHKCL